MKHFFLLITIFISVNILGQKPGDSCTNPSILQVDTEYEINDLETSQFTFGAPIQEESETGKNVRGFWLRVSIPSGYYAKNIEIYEVSNNFDPVIGLKSNCSYTYYPNVNTNYANENGKGGDEIFHTGLTGPDSINDGIYHIRIYHYNNSEAPKVSFKIKITDGSTSSSDFDLSISNEKVDNTTPNIGDKIKLSCHQNFSGSCDCDELSPDPKVGYYLSTNNTFESDIDTYLKYDTSSIGDKDKDDPESYSWTIPNDIKSGNYYILFVADYNAKHTEYNENNNVKSVAITIGSNTCSPVIITKNPANQSVSSGNTATFSVSATGSSPISYQWYKNSTIISGATNTSYTTPKLNTTDDGNSYQCKITNCDGTKISNSATVSVTEVNSTGNISGNFFAPYVDDNFQIQNNLSSGFIIKLYENGNSNSIMQTSVNNNNFVFTNVPTGNYHVVAEKIENGTIVSSVKKTFVSTGSSVTLKSSYKLINQISNYNEILYNLTCEIDVTNKTYPLKNSFGYSYNDINSLTTYIQDTSNSFIVDNDEAIIDKLSRFVIVTKATKQYFDAAKDLTNEYITTLRDATKIFFDFLSYLKCRNPNFIIANSTYKETVFVETFKWLYVEILSSITINGENLYNSSTINASFDLLYSYVTKQNQFSYTDYGDVITVIGLDKIWVNNFINRGYIYKTYDNYSNSIKNIVDSNQSLSLNELSNHMKQKLSESRSLVSSTNINVTSYRNLPRWIEMTFEFGDILGSNTCHAIPKLIGFLTNALEASLVYDSMLHSYIGKSDLKNRANSNIYYASQRIGRNKKSSNDPDYILPLIQKIESKLKAYNNKIESLIVDINNNTLSTVSIDELSNLTVEISAIQNILSITFTDLKLNSNLSTSVFNEMLSQSMFQSPALRLAFLITFQDYLNNQNDTLKSDLNDNYQELISKNQSTIANLYPLKNSLSSTDLEIRLGIVNDNIPSVIGVNAENEFKIDIFNYGSVVANNIVLEIESNNLNATFNKVSYNVGSINPFEKNTISVPINTSANTGATSYTLKIIKDSKIVNEVERVITTRDFNTLSINDTNNYTDIIFENPISDIIYLGDSFNKIDKLEIFNNLGQKVFSKNTISRELNVSILKTGVYYLKIYSDNQVNSIKIIKK